MKEICGYQDSKGKFHKTKESCEKAELNIRIFNVQRQLSNFDVELSNYFMQNSNYRHREDYNTYNIEEFLQIVAKCVLQNSDMFLEIISKKGQYKKDLDILEKQYTTKYGKPWYLKIKWW